MIGCLLYSGLGNGVKGWLIEHREVYFCANIVACAACCGNCTRPHSGNTPVATKTAFSAIFWPGYVGYLAGAVDRWSNGRFWRLDFVDDLVGTLLARPYRPARRRTDQAGDAKG